MSKGERVVRFGGIRPIILAAALTATATGGCSTSVTIAIKYAETGAPVEGIWIEQQRPVSRAAKIVNPVGSFYHPISFIEAISTDTNGHARFREACSRDGFQIHPKEGQLLLVTAWGKEVRLPANTNQVYSVWLENGQLKQLLSPAKN
jgi:hypothetical protein